MTFLDRLNSQFRKVLKYLWLSIWSVLELPVAYVLEVFPPTRLAFWFKDRFPDIWSRIMSVEWAQNAISKGIFRRFGGATPPRPHQATMADDYTSWRGLVDKRFTGRHLPVDPNFETRTRPDAEDVVSLFLRSDDRTPGGTIESDMRYYSILVCLGVPFLGFPATGADADTAPIYNDACMGEVSAFQQASNFEAVTDARHDLLLCLADDAYISAHQRASGYLDWPDGRYFQIFAENMDVKVADTPVGAAPQSQTAKRTERALAGGVLFTGDARSCSCPRAVIKRGPGDATDPLKAEGFDVYMTFNLGGVMSEGPEGFAKMKGVLDQMSAAGTIPLTAERQAANVIAQFGDVKNWANVNDPGALTGNTNIGVQDFDWDPQSSTDWIAKLNAQSVTNDLSTCGCPEYRIPLTRSGGDGVPSLWREGQDVFFSTNDVRALTKTLLQTMTDETLVEQ